MNARWSVALLIAAGCGDDPPSGGSEVGTTSGSSTTSGLDTTGEGSTTTEAEPQTSTSSSTGGASTTTGTGTEGSSSTGGVPNNCGDNTADPGDVCFGPDTVFVMGQSTQDLVVADFDRDNNLDVATLDIRPDPDLLLVALGDGDGNFGEPQSFETVDSAFRLAVGDVDLDGDPEVIVLGNDMTIFMNEAGTLVPHQADTAGLFVDQLNDGAVGRFDDQLGFDLVHTNLSQVYFQRGQISTDGWDFFSVAIVPGGHADGSTGMAAHPFDFDGDDIEDLVILGREEPTARVLLADGAGGFGSGSETDVCESSAGGYRVAVGELNGDAFEDLVVSCDNDTFTVSFGQGDAAFSAFEEYAWPTVFTSRIVDVSNDDINDVIVADAGTGEIGIFANDGAGGLDLRKILNVFGTCWTFSVADVNEDGLQDIIAGATADDEGRFEVYLGEK